MTEKSAVEIACQQRHLHLLQKVKDNKPLTAVEMRELKGYEGEHGGETPKADIRNPTCRTSPKSTLAAVEPAPRKLTAASVREAGMECETMAGAEDRLRIEDLAGQLEKSKRLLAAWEKGRRLRDIRALAVAPISQADASQQLGLGETGLARLCERDPEVRDIWDRGRVALRIEVQRGLLKNAAAGKADALAAIEKILHGRFGGGETVDFGRLTPTQIAEATGIRRQVFRRWHIDNQLPRNADGTFSLPQFVAWLKKWVLAKASSGGSPASLNPLQAEKARKVKVEADLLEDRVVPIETVLTMLRQRAARTVQVLSDNRAEDWAQAHEGKTAAQLKDLYRDAFRDLREDLKKMSTEVPLPPAAKAKFEEAFAELMKDSA
jgi:hypothetical protein